MDNVITNLSSEIKGAFFDNSYSPFVILDKDLIFVDINLAAETKLGISREKMIGKSLLDIFPYLKNSERYAAYKNVLVTGVPIGFDELTFSNGVSEHKFMIRAFKVGEYLGFTSLDVTNLITTVEKLRETKDDLKNVNANLKRKNQELEEFSYVAAHDLRAPLTNIKSLLMMISNSNALPLELEPIFTKLNEAGQSMCDKVKALNTIISVKSNFGGEVEKVSFSKLLDKIKNDHSQEIIKNRIIIKQNFSNCQQVEYNRDQLNLILENLISNAIKFRCEKRKLIIKVGVKEIEGKCHIEIADNGIGFDSCNNKEKIFGLFKRMHDHVDGLGIGLYLVNSIVRDNGGSISVESKVNQGSTFKIIL